MANVKEVRIEAEVPFNCADHFEMAMVLGRLAVPDYGLKAVWTPLPDRLNQYGGKTAFYRVVISGREAVAPAWLYRVGRAVIACGGGLGPCRYRDLEGATDVFGKAYTADQPWVDFQHEVISSRPTPTQAVVVPVVYYDKTPDIVKQMNLRHLVGDLLADTTEGKDKKYRLPNQPILLDIDRVEVLNY